MNYITRVLALVLVILFACTAGLTACAPVNNVIPASTPEPTATPSPSPTSSPTPTPEPTPTPTPKLTREEALSKLNITSNELHMIGHLILFRCTLEDGSIREFIVCSYFRVLEPGVYEIRLNNVLDDTTFATYTTTDDGYKSQYNMMEHHEITLVPEFLHGATITYTDGLCSWPWYIDPLPESKYMDMLADIAREYDTTNDMSVLNKWDTIILDSIESANLILDIIPYENMVWASDYIEGFVEKTPEVK